MRKKSDMPNENPPHPSESVHLALGLSQTAGFWAVETERRLPISGVADRDR
jgi:hypothetical protein